MLQSLGVISQKLFTENQRCFSMASFPIKTRHFPVEFPSNPRTHQLVLQGTHRAGRGEDAVPVWNAPALAAPLKAGTGLGAKWTRF